MNSPRVIFVTSAGSPKRLPHSRQKAIAATSAANDNTASTVISHVVGIVRPKNTRSIWDGAQSM